LSEIVANDRLHEVEIPSDETYDETSVPVEPDPESEVEKVDHAEDTGAESIPDPWESRGVISSKREAKKVKKAPAEIREESKVNKGKRKVGLASS
jgi:hypothetical protein